MSRGLIEIAILSVLKYILVRCPYLVISVMIGKLD